MIAVTIIICTFLYGCALMYYVEHDKNWYNSMQNHR